MATQQTLTRTAPRIKLVIADDEKYKEHLYWLGCVGNDLRNLRNDVMRECVSYLQKQIDGEPLPVNEKGKTIDCRTYAGQRRKKYDYANGTLCNWTEFLTVKTFKQYKKQILAGKANIPMFKDKSIPIYGKGSRLWVENGEFFLKPPAMNGIVFKFVNPEKNKSLAAILERVLSGEYSFDFSKIIKDDKFWYLHLSYTFEKVPDPNLDPTVVCGIDLGWVVPAYCGLNEGPQR